MKPKKAKNIVSKESPSYPELAPFLEKIKGKTCVVVHPENSHVVYIKNVIDKIEDVMKGFNIETTTLGLEVVSQKSNFRTILGLLKECVLGIVIIDGLRPNVLLEYGILLGLGKPTIVLKDENADINVENLYIDDNVKQKIKKIGNPKLDVDKHLSDVKDLHYTSYDWREPSNFKKILNCAFIKIKEEILLEITTPMLTARIEKQKPKVRSEFQEMFSELVQYGIKLIEFNPKDIDNLSKKLNNLSRKYKVKLSENYYFDLGNIYCGITKFDEALKAYDMAIGINPYNFKAWSNKGVVLYKLGRYHEALKSCDKAIELNPYNFKAWSNKGVVLYKLGRYDEALKAYDKAIEIKPDYAGAWYNKGVVLGKLGRYDEPPLKAFDKAIELKPDFAEAWYNKGVALDELGRYDEALKAYDKAIELKPDDATAWYNRAYVYSLKGNKENAIKNLSKAIELDKEFKEKAKKDEDFKNLWDDNDFKRITS